MSMLKSVVSGRLSVPELLVLYGPDGIGKSTFAAAAPNPIFLGAESGTANLDVARFPAPKSFADCLTASRELLEEKHDYKTLVVDTLDWMEPLVFDKLCKDSGVDRVEDSCGGYGKWVNASVNLWREYLRSLSALRDARFMNVIMLAHAQLKTFQDPQTNTGYDRYQLKLQDKAGALIREFVDSVLFANFEVHTKEDNKKRTRAFGDGTRKLYTERRPAFDAKNRWNLPKEMPLSWEDYAAAKAAGSSAGPSVIVAQIEELAAQLPDAAIKAKISEAVKKAGNSSANLNVILNRLRTMLAS